MKRFLIFFMTIFFSFITVYGQMRWNQQYQNYIDQYKDLAIEQMLRYRIPASITLAQGLFESGAGRSELAVKGNNHFGIKCHGWTGKKTYHDDDASQECFRAYNNVFESYEDHSKFLSQQSRYSRLFKLSIMDYKGWAYGLKAAGYATNPVYAQKLIEVIELYKLYQYDHARSYDKFMVRRSERDKPVQSNGMLHPIHIYNKNYYLQARQGDTFSSIADEVGIPAQALARYNERDRRDMLEVGDIIYLKKKRAKADKSFKNRPHRVKVGESMYTISQLYGIRLKKLYQMNSLDPNTYQIRPGDLLWVY